MRQNLLGYCRWWTHTIVEQPYDFFVDINDLDGGEQHIEPILMALSQTFYSPDLAVEVAMHRSIAAARTAQKEWR